MLNTQDKEDIPTCSEKLSAWFKIYQYESKWLRRALNTRDIKKGVEVKIEWRKMEELKAKENTRPRVEENLKNKRKNIPNLKLTTFHMVQKYQHGNRLHTQVEITTSSKWLIKNACDYYPLETEKEVIDSAKRSHVTLSSIVIKRNLQLQKVNVQQARECWSYSSCISSITRSEDQHFFYNILALSASLWPVLNLAGSTQISNILFLYPFCIGSLLK